MILRLLGWRGIAGIGVALALSILLAVQKVETPPLEGAERQLRATVQR